MNILYNEQVYVKMQLVCIKICNTLLTIHHSFIYLFLFLFTLHMCQSQIYSLLTDTSITNIIVKIKKSAYTLRHSFLYLRQKKKFFHYKQKRNLVNIMELTELISNQCSEEMTLRLVFKCHK